MNWNPLLALLCFAYSVMVVWIAAKKPTSMWEMAKIRWFRKALGEKGTVIFFYIWALIFIGVGIWLIGYEPIGY